jgi:hypothetical protein
LENLRRLGRFAEPALARIAAMSSAEKTQERIQQILALIRLLRC